MHKSFTKQKTLNGYLGMSIAAFSSAVNKKYKTESNNLVRYKNTWDKSENCLIQSEWKVKETVMPAEADSTSAGVTATWDWIPVTRPGDKWY